MLAADSIRTILLFRRHRRVISSQENSLKVSLDPLAESFKQHGRADLAMRCLLNSRHVLVQIVTEACAEVQSMFQSQHGSIQTRRGRHRLCVGVTSIPPLKLN